MNYIGSKLKLSSWIKDEVKRVVGDDLSDKVFCDLFAGTGIVGRVFKRDVKRVIANDLEHYSYVLNRNYIQNYIFISDRYRYIDELNALHVEDDGFIYKNYCMGSGSKRCYFSDHNGKKIDTIRKKIEEWKKNKKIGDELYYFLLASLVESADLVANTASVYGAYLKKIKKSASREMIMKAADFSIYGNNHTVFMRDSNSLVREIKGDILYIDPPYNHRQYGANYHILNTITLYDDFQPKGKTGVRRHESSKYCKKRDVFMVLEDLIQNSNFKYIFLSYNSEGIVAKEWIENMMSKYGEYCLKIKKHKRFKTETLTSRKSIFEYLHILKK